MQRPRFVAWLAWLAPAALACSVNQTVPEKRIDPEDTRPGQVAVEVYGGLGAPRAAAPQAPKRVSLIVDLSPSMLHEAPGEASHLETARASAAELLYSLREGTEVSLRTLGHVPADSCGRSERVAGPLVPERREPLVQQLGSMQPASEGSLARALVDERRTLMREGAATRSRVVVFSDLDGSCGGDICAAAADLVSAGASLELVTVGNATPPACLAELRPESTPPSRVSQAFEAEPRRFVVQRARSGEDPAPVLGVGRAGVEPVAVPAGMVTVVLELDPPEEIGPFLVRPGELARVRLLETFDAALPTRVWRVERRDEPVARAFPPPPEATIRRETKP